MHEGVSQGICSSVNGSFQNLQVPHTFGLYLAKTVPTAGLVSGVEVSAIGAVPELLFPSFFILLTPEWRSARRSGTRHRPFARAKTHLFKEQTNMAIINIQF